MRERFSFLKELTRVVRLGKQDTRHAWHRLTARESSSNLLLLAETGVVAVVDPYMLSALPLRTLLASVPCCPRGVGCVSGEAVLGDPQNQHNNAGSARERDNCN